MGSCDSKTRHCLGVDFPWSMWRVHVNISEYLRDYPVPAKGSGRWKQFAKILWLMWTCCSYCLGL